MKETELIHGNHFQVEFEVPGKPRATAIGRALMQLNPTELEVEDFSESHKGHAHAGDETHIRIKVVSEAFEDMPLVLRHKVRKESSDTNVREDLYLRSWICTVGYLHVAGLIYG